MTCAMRSQLERAHLIYGFSSLPAPRWLFREHAGPRWHHKGYCGWSSVAHTTLWVKCEDFFFPTPVVDFGSSESLLHIRSAEWNAMQLVWISPKQVSYPEFCSSLTTDNPENSCLRTMCTPDEGERVSGENWYRIDSPSFSLNIQGSARKSHFGSAELLLVSLHQFILYINVLKGINRGAFSSSLKHPHSRDKGAELGKHWISIWTAFWHCLQLFGDCCSTMFCLKQKHQGSVS